MSKIGGYTLTCPIDTLLYLCQVGNLTSWKNTQCLCTHLTSFGGDLVVPPNTINFATVFTKFKNLGENAAVFSTIVSIFGLWLISLIWARHQDKKDLLKVV